MLREMLEAMRQGQRLCARGETSQVEAVQAEVQYQSAKKIADQYISVHSSDGEGLLPCHASRSLDTLGAGIERLLVVVHGALRDSDKYFEHAYAAAQGMRSSTLIVAPQFLADVDLDVEAAAPDGTLYWEVEGWKGGERALGPAPISSFTAMDCLLQQLTAPERVPGGKQPAVVIIGNSAGGQYVNRYAAVGHGPDALAKRGISVRFIIANPSTYLYFNEERPVAVAGGTGINRWRYGFEAAPDYVDGTPQQSLKRYLDRDVTIVLGAEDRDSAALLLEVSAAAMAQGANRHERGINYHAHIHRLATRAGLVASHKVIQLDGVGHAANDVLAAQKTREIMFG
jgi:hypothetical protein